MALPGEQPNDAGGAGPVDLVIISGYSGAGKSEAMAAFEDNGYFCVDNLPPRLLASLGELFLHVDAKVRRAAVVIDVRGGQYFRELLDVLDELEAEGVRPRIVFLTASEESLLNRFKETRRRHPLAPEGRVLEGIREEVEILTPLRERADKVLDTSDMTGAMLRRRIVTEIVGGGVEAAKLAVTILTFGFKNGPPRDADLMFDVRFLPNPHYRQELRPLTGKDPAVVEYAESGTLAADFYARLFPLLDFLLPAYIAEGKTHLNIAVGCTGGRHRSVAVADRIATHVDATHDDIAVATIHRDCDL